MADVKHTAEQVIEAIKGSNGIKATVMRRLGVHRNTVDNYLKRYATAQQAYEDEIEQIGDIAESLIITDMVTNRNVETAKWYAKAKLVKRGYGDKVEQNHSGEIGVVIVKGYANVNPDDWDKDTANSSL